MVAQGQGAFLLQEPKTVLLKSDQEDHEVALAMDLSIDDFQSSRPVDLVNLSFDLRVGEAGTGTEDCHGVGWRDGAAVQCELPIAGRSIRR